VFRKLFHISSGLEEQHLFYPIDIDQVYIKFKIYIATAEIVNPLVNASWVYSSKVS
jgi:hypothetical protein